MVLSVKIFVPVGVETCSCHAAACTILLTWPNIFTFDLKVLCCVKFEKNRIFDLQWEIWQCFDVRRRWNCLHNFFY